ncbi:hypothetical protein LQ327_25810 [Actinomycetospora endophytica]|uniref:Uncharacterized protein n=1 Tax=Actinomycetospora endophytica TaxID=2291215 RepID=A0ABS8PFR6_9PSEU|nr:hypothetical protein [Actinomycetospora endophytica]MCD2196792.1 hypothetical protein [Actinomycetospora endophytica]
MGDTQTAFSFYQTLASISFTLLGLWFVVLGIGRGDWGSPARHRERLHVALFFFLPGTMGLASVLGGTNPLAWRVVFVLGAVIGLVESVPFLIGHQGLPGTVERVLGVLAPLLYLLVALAAFVPGPRAGLAPLQIEGFVIAAVFLLGLTHLWRAFAETPVAVSSRPR